MAQPRHIGIGLLGEQIAAKRLETLGFRIIATNYRKPWGELDIVAEKDEVLHFVEVKAGSWHGPWPIPGSDIYRPEDHLHATKRARMARTVQTYLAERRMPSTQPWTVDLAVVLINEGIRRARVRWVHDVLL